MDLQPLIDRLAEFPPGDHPFVSVYLDARPDQVGREKYHAFVRTELKARAETYPEHSPARESIDADIERIKTWLEREVRPQSNGIAIFACAAAGFFEGVQFDVPIERNEVFVGPAPHLYPLAAVADRYRRHAAVVLDTHSARIFVMALGEVTAETAVESAALPRSEAGGWSQARYQRHVEEFQRHHAREVAEALERLVREERVERIVVAANDVARPLLRAELPKELDRPVKSSPISSDRQEVGAGTARPRSRRGLQVRMSVSTIIRPRRPAAVQPRCHVPHVPPPLPHTTSDRRELRTGNPLQGVSTATGFPRQVITTSYPRRTASSTA
jgi:hypothetical protein